MPTHYHTLKVAEDAPPEVIKAAYRALSQQHHPDSKRRSQDEAVRAMQAINEAYEVLIEPGSRAIYDQKLQMEREAAAQTGLEPGGEATSEGRGGSLVKRDSDGPEVADPRRLRRRRSRSHSRRSDKALVPVSSEVYYQSPGRSHVSSMVRAGSSLEPLFKSSQSTIIHGRRLSESAPLSETPTVPPPPGKRGCSVMMIVLATCTLGVLALGGLVAWRVGWVGRFWGWFQREQALEASRGLVFGGPNDVMPMLDANERLYTRPALTPRGHPWPETTGYLAGTEQSHDSGHCEIVVDNVLHDSDVHAKLVALPGAGGGVPVVVREAFITKRSQMRFENLPPGTYELWYRSHASGLIFRAAAGELSQDASKGDSTTVSLYKVVPGNVQRPVMSEEAFDGDGKTRQSPR